MADDNIQHGIDDNPENDAEKAAALGGIGGAVVGAAAGSVVPGGGTLVGAVVGAVGGALASGAAVAGVDRVDNDDTVSGVGDGVTPDANDTTDYTDTTYTGTTDAGYVGTATSDTNYGTTGSTIGNDVPGIQTGGTAVDGTMDTRGISEKTADAITGDRIDDKTGKIV
jgi:hypothetical protein